MRVPKFIKDEYPSAKQYKSQQLFKVQAGRNCLYISYGNVVAAAVDGQLFVTDATYTKTTTAHVNLIRKTEVCCTHETATPEYLRELSEKFLNI